MVLVALPVSIVGALVTLALPKETVFVENGPKVGAPGKRLVSESMSFGWLVLENSGERLKTVLVGLLLA